MRSPLLTQAGFWGACSSPLHGRTPQTVVLPFTPSPPSLAALGPLSSPGSPNLSSHLRGTA